MTAPFDQIPPNAEQFRQTRAAADHLDEHLSSAIAEFSQGNTVVTVPSPTGFVPGEISSLFKDLRARKDAMVADLKTNAADMSAILAAGEQMNAGLKADADALRAEFGQLTNFPPA